MSHPPRRRNDYITLKSPESPLMTTRQTADAHRRGCSSEAARGRHARRQRVEALARAPTPAPLRRPRRRRRARARRGRRASPPTRSRCTRAGTSRGAGGSIARPAGSCSGSSVAMCPFTSADMPRSATERGGCSDRCASRLVLWRRGVAAVAPGRRWRGGGGGGLQFGARCGCRRWAAWACARAASGWSGRGGKRGWRQGAGCRDAASTARGRAGLLGRGARARRE